MTSLVLRSKRLALLAALLAGVVVAAASAGGAWWYSQVRSEAVARALTAGDPSRAPELIRRYGCSGCHTIPGIQGADGLVGAPLRDLRRRVYVGGVVFNS